MKTVELTEKEYELLAYALGIAIGTAMKDSNPKLAERIRELNNKIIEAPMDKDREL